MNNAITFPKHAVVIERNNDKAQVMMLKLGILNSILAKKAEGKEVSSAAIADHPTHWIIGSHHQGHPDPDECGFQLIACPKSLMNEKGFATALTMMSGYLDCAKVEFVDPIPFEKPF